MLVALALIAITNLCRPGDLLCRENLPAAELAMIEVPDFLPESHECWQDGPCANPRLTVDMVHAYIRNVSPALQGAKLPDGLTREATRETEIYHHQCNTDVRATFAKSFKAGDFRPSFRDEYRLATEAFFRSAAWVSLKELRAQQSPSEAAGQYEPSVARLPRRLRADFGMFSRSAAGRWWFASRNAAWRRTLGPSSEAHGMCPAATASFHRQLVGLLVEHGMTKPIEYLATRRP